MRLDHLVYAVADLDAAAARFEHAHGLASVAGGEHEGIGTGNRIIPLGSSYIELMGVVDERMARANPFGAHFLSFVAAGDGPFGWCVATDDIDGVCSAHGLEASPWTRVRPDGTELRWRLAGVETTITDRSLPFFIQWDCPPDDHPGRAEAPHRTEARALAWIEVAGDAGAIRARTLGADLPVRVVGGERGPRRVGIATDEGEIVIG